MKTTFVYEARCLDCDRGEILFERPESFGRPLFPCLVGK